MRLHEVTGPYKRIRRLAIQGGEDRAGTEACLLVDRLASKVASVLVGRVAPPLFHAPRPHPVGQK